jgi:enediyne biosynthesis protein E4
MHPKKSDYGNTTLKFWETRDLMLNKLILPSLFITASISLAQNVTMTAQPLQVSECSSTFVSHELDFITRVHDPEHIGAYDSNGTGVAVGDLDNDQDIDMVLANLKGNNAILWNEGSLQFRKEELDQRNSRAVAIVDIDGDSWNDIVFTQSITAPIFYFNQQGAFEKVFRPDVGRQAYSMAWADVDGDTDLDLITASYDTLLEKELRDTFMLSSKAGVVIYNQTPEGFVEKRITDESQALALILFDVNADQKLDILVGNDFAIPDFIYTNVDGEWKEASPFAVTSRNTMSFDVGDIDNNGQSELFATDMKPDFSDLNILAQWMPLMQKTYEQQKAFPKQRVENALQRFTENGFENQSYKLRLDSTGWSWSGKFADLDNDGRLDIYVVNGMMDEKVLSHLPNYELIEENQVFHNLGNDDFERVDWGLNSIASGRGMTMADLDSDGDLDIVVNNLESPSLIFENQICGGNALEVDLRWTTANTRAIGATLKLHTNQGTFLRDVRVSSGYLSGDTSRIHFGVPENATIESLEILWPDGQSTNLENLEHNSLVTISRKGDL